MNYPLACLGSLAIFNPPPPKSLGTEPVAFVPMASVSADGLMAVAEYKGASDLFTGYSYFQDGDILLAKITPCYENNKIALAHINTLHGFGSTEFHVVRPDPRRLDSRFALHFLRQERIRDAGALRMTGSAGQRRVPKSFLQTLELALPPIPEQRRIAAILDQADELRRKRRVSYDLLKEVTDAVFLQVFGDPIRNPRGYPVRKLNQLVDPNRGISYGVVKRGEDQDHGVPIIRISDVVDGIIDPRKIKLTKPEIAAKYRRTKLVGDELVISIRGTVGRCATVPSELAGGNVSRELAVIPTLDASLNCFYIALLRSRSTQYRLTQDIKGIAQRGINLEDLWELPIIQPGADDIAHFIETYARIEAVQNFNRDHIAKLDALFTSLQHRAFKGELPASLPIAAQRELRLAG